MVTMLAEMASIPRRCLDIPIPSFYPFIGR
jgi:hypothetical protein